MTDRTSAVTAALDLETRLARDDHHSIKLWLRLLTCANLIESEIRRRLHDRYGTSLARFDLLAQLERAPHGLRMSELSARLMVTRGNITGLADQLAAEGYVTREAHAADRRGVKLHLTPAGRDRFRDMAREHEGWVIELLEGLAPDERDALHELLGQLKHTLTRTEARP